MFKRRSIYLSHVSFILLHCNYWLGTSKQQGHCATGKNPVNKGGSPSANSCPTKHPTKNQINTHFKNKCLCFTKKWFHFLQLEITHTSEMKKFILPLPSNKQAPSDHFSPSSAYFQDELRFHKSGMISSSPSWTWRTVILLSSPSRWPDSVPQLFQRRRVQPVPVPAAEGPGDEGHRLPSSLIGQALLPRHPSARGMRWADAPGGHRRLLLRPQGTGEAKGGKRPSPAPTGWRAPRRGGRVSGRSSPPLPCPCRPGGDPPRPAPASPAGRHRPTSHLHHRSRKAAMLRPPHRHPGGAKRRLSSPRDGRALSRGTTGAVVWGHRPARPHGRRRRAAPRRRRPPMKPTDGDTVG